MIDRTQLQQLAPAQRAELIYTQVKSDLAAKLWRAALGGEPNPQDRTSRVSELPGSLDLESMLSLFCESPGNVPACSAETPKSDPDRKEEGPSSTPVGAGFNKGLLGSNEQHAAALTSAAGRSGIPVAALASIVEAEAAKRSDGSWNTLSRNPRSSAAGLGQFLSSTWENEAERKGTWLNDTAAERGWLDGAGRVKAGYRSALLNLRYDAAASIHATADYAQYNVDRLRKAGIDVGNDVRNVARAAYLSHHLGPGDALKFLGRGLNRERAELLLHAQVGAGAASRKIAAAGDATDAHRRWLNSYIDRQIKPERFTA